ncbi:hypothetical protein C4546_02180 [Candidatus Parcubacteria bacterium]|nr:MAG: hypothetical protein C4546_02180 [Candidatus Parcubacteria bacterium]
MTNPADLLSSFAWFFKVKNIEKGVPITVASMITKIALALYRTQAKKAFGDDPSQQKSRSECSTRGT